MTTDFESIKKPQAAPKSLKNINKALFILRGLPGCGSEKVAEDLMTLAVKNGVKSVVILSSADFLKDKGGNITKDLVSDAHRKNYERAILHFMAGTQIVILDNYNITRSHFRHYVNSAKSLGYDWYETVVGSVTPTPEEIEGLIKATGGKFRAEIIVKYVKEFED